MKMTNYRNIQVLLSIVLVAITSYWLLTIAGFWQGVFICINLGALYCYGLDKYRAANNSRKRIPERFLLGVAVIGGVPGSIIGQLIFRHKTLKQPFRNIFWAIAILQVIILTCIYIKN